MCRFFPGDILTIEQSGLFKGALSLPFRLLSPLEGLGPKEIGLSELVQRIHNEKPAECLVALASTVEGEATTSNRGQHQWTNTSDTSRRECRLVVSSIILMCLRYPRR